MMKHSRLCFATQRGKLLYVRSVRNGYGNNMLGKETRNHHHRISKSHVGAQIPMTHSAVNRENPLTLKAGKDRPCMTGSQLLYRVPRRARLPSPTFLGRMFACLGRESGLQRRCGGVISDWRTGKNLRSASIRNEAHTHALVEPLQTSISYCCQQHRHSPTSNTTINTGP
ncbi:hypothetical protein CC80DRAFT_206784 [Byssothecium circinans]|uniref:Uncharacterized protein n=1 Tax=Byssothecium circinans TaxID=147558 RepID=A0A6A5TR64_9PLEO|nr:hypothetical protein CC80DRAFT_206784 [Byssothecium circinans]